MDRLVIDTEILKNAAEQFSGANASLADVYGKALQALASVRSAAPGQDNIIRSVSSLSSRINSAADRAGTLSGSCRSAAEMWEKCERGITGEKQWKTFIDYDVTIRASGLSKDDMDQMAKECSFMISGTHTVVENAYSKGKLDLVAGASYVYGVMNENADQLLIQQYITSKNLLNSLLQNNASMINTDNTELLSELFGKLKDNSECLAILAGLDGCKELMDSCNSISDLMDALQTGTDRYDIVFNALNNCLQMMAMDPAEAHRIADGLRASGDLAAIATADALDCCGDPLKCLAYSVTTAGLELGYDGVSDVVMEVVNEAIEGNATLNALSKTAKVTTAITDATMGTQSTADAAIYANNIDSIQSKCYDAAQNAIADYNANKTPENYQKMVNACEAYNATAAEALDAYADAVDARDSSSLGRMIFGDKNADYKQTLHNGADGFRTKNQTLEKLQSTLAMI